MEFIPEKNLLFGEPSEEDDQDYWNGEGELSFRVLSYSKGTVYPWEIEYTDYTGCVGGLIETVGIEYAINEGMLIDQDKLRVGYSYTLHGVTVIWTRGDGWTTDDDVDYYVESVTTHFELIPWIKAQWWQHFGWKLREWMNK